MTEERKPTARLIMLLGGLALLLTGGSVSAASAKSQPQLQVISVRAARGEQRPFHAFARGGGLPLDVTIENTGQAPLHGRLHYQDLEVQAKTSLSLGRFVYDASFDLPTIRPGKKVVVRVEAMRHEERITTVIPRVCVPVHGVGNFGRSPLPHVRTDCRTGPPFAVIPEGWEGAMSSKAPDYGHATVSNDSLPRFRYDPNSSESQDTYVYQGSGTSAYAASGSNVFPQGTCSFSGGENATIAPRTADLLLKPDLRTYSGGVFTTDVFTAMESCNGGPAFPIPSVAPSIQIPPTPFPDDLDVSATRLTGSATESSPAGTTTTHWDLDATR